MDPACHHHDDHDHDGEDGGLYYRYTDTLHPLVHLQGKEMKSGGGRKANSNNKWLPINWCNCLVYYDNEDDVVQVEEVASKKCSRHLYN